MARSPLLFRDVGEEAWAAFHAAWSRQPQRRIPSLRAAGEERRSSPRGDAPVETALERAWSRAKALGASDTGPGDEELLLRGEALKARTEPLEELWASAPGLVDRALVHPALRDFVLLFADVEGLVARTLGGGAFADEARRLRLIAGASWSEAARGTNAIGTAIAEARPVAVEGHAHFGRRYHELVCYAAPVHDATGRVVAVLDATSTRAVVEGHDASFGTRVLDAVSSTALGIEEVLRLRAYASAGHAVTRVLTRALERIGCPVLVVEPPGRIARCNESARVDLGVASTHGMLETHLRLGWDELVREAMAPSAGGAIIEERLTGRTWRLKAEPVEATDGRLLAVVAFLERARVGVPARESERPSSTGRESERPSSTGREPSRSEAREQEHPSSRPRADAFDTIFAEDAAVRGAVDLARRVAPSELAVMLLAETGSGKELFAQALHRASPRAKGPFVALNCGSIAPTLLESELFGHAPGAFTGASPRGRAGLLHAATGGTLFLDEIGEMPLSMQTSLLRVLETGAYLRVGETKESRADVRIVCATCKDLPAMVQAGTFRSDLYFRLKGVVLRLPPLRERRDRVALTRHLLAIRSETRPLSDALVAWVEQHRWPGNVRELRTVLDVVRVLAADAPMLDAAHLPPDLTLTPTSAAGNVGEGLAEVEASVVRRALDELGWNVSAAARQLGIARSTVYRMVEKYGLKRG